MRRRLLLREDVAAALEEVRVELPEAGALAVDEVVHVRAEQVTDPWFVSGCHLTQSWARKKTELTQKRQRGVRQ